MEADDAIAIAPEGAPRIGAEEAALIERLLRKDSAAFAWLVKQHHAMMVRLALTMVPSRAVAEEVAQETWQAVLQRLPSFEGRSSLKTWIFRILVKRSRTRGVRERRSLPFAAFSASDEDGELPVDLVTGADRRPLSSEHTPERALMDQELRAAIEAGIAELPETLRLVLTLRDVAGWPSDEVCNVLEVTETNQRVMLHRARVKMRERLAMYLEGNS